MSAILSADDLNDFISPGVACIKPVETLRAAPPQPDPSSLEIEVIRDGQQPSTAAAPAQISLTDCLACSGCVTSAEAVLVSLQSHSEVLSALDVAPALRIEGPNNTTGRYNVQGLEDESSLLYVASVSPQTRASLAAACGAGVTEREAGYMIERLLRDEDGLRTGGRWGNGFTWVVDTDAALEACLVLGSDEALETSLTETTALARPILTSSCPGWVCYAEKTHPHVLPHLSKVKSPQALMGTLLKSVLSRTLDIPPHRIWHLAVMPCFDKKLEASRGELTSTSWADETVSGAGGVRDVDCVITSKEILMLTASRALDFFSLSKTPITQPQLPFPEPVLHNFLFPTAKRRRIPPTAGTSGGQLYYLLEDMCSRHAGARIVTTRGRNADVVEYVVEAASGEVIFRAARYYGFRNIQNLVRRLRPARQSRMPGAKPIGSARKPAGAKASTSPEYAYVEVMACPGGCTNGGGQLKVDDPVIRERKGFDAKPGPDAQKDWLALVDEAYFSGDESDLNGRPETSEGRSNDTSPTETREFLARWAGAVGIDLRLLVYTSYREVISDVGKPRTSDTERVVQLAGKIGGGW